MTVPEELILDDPAAIRAMSHPVRQFAATELYAAQIPRTATELANLRGGGISASSMSYHLRELESIGIICRGTATDGRERPWVAAARSYTLQTSEATGPADRGALLDAYLEPIRARMHGHLARRSRLAPDDQDTTFNVLSTGELFLPESHIKKLCQELAEVFRRYENLSRSVAESAQADAPEAHDPPVRSHYLWSVVPDNPDAFNKARPAETAPIADAQADQTSSTAALGVLTDSVWAEDHTNQDK